jgi:hypothetical protein
VTTKVRLPRQLINHRDVAEKFGTSARNWRRWVETGDVPIPHQQIGTLLLYDIAVITHRLETGKWPEGSVFRPKVEKAAKAGRKTPSADATPTG